MSAEADILLSEALDLCVRARKLDGMRRREAHLEASIDPEAWIASGRFAQFVEMSNADNRHTPISTRSATMPLWAADQYDRDLADWEQRARAYLEKVMFS